MKLNSNQRIRNRLLMIMSSVFSSGDKGSYVISRIVFRFTMYMLAFFAICISYQIIGCPIRFVFGIPCPGCGMTRALSSILHGDIHDAFSWHPLFPAVIPFFLLIIKKNGQLFGSKHYYKLFFAAFILLFIGTYIYRMINMFPNFQPMVYNSNAIINKIILFIRGGT